jgi:hypothetical protein
MHFLIKHYIFSTILLFYVTGMIFVYRTARKDTIAEKHFWSIGDCILWLILVMPVTNIFIMLMMFEEKSGYDIGDLFPWLGKKFRHILNKPCRI